MEEEQNLEEHTTTTASAHLAHQKRQPDQPRRLDTVPSYAAALAPPLQSSIGSEAALAPAVPAYAQAGGGLAGAPSMPAPVYEGVRLARQRAEESGSNLRYNSSGSAVGELSGRFRFPGRRQRNWWSHCRMTAT